MPQGLPGMGLTHSEYSLNTDPGTQWEVSQHWTWHTVGTLNTDPGTQ